MQQKNKQIFFLLQYLFLVVWTATKYKYADVYMPVLTHFRLVFHIVNYAIHYVVYSEQDVLHLLGQCWLQAVF